MNRVVLMGRLVKDPEVRVTPNGKTACTFTLAVDRPFTAKNGQKEADFINIVTWNKTAEVCGNHLNKGQRTLLEGRLQIRSYDGKDGNKHYVTEVIADRVELIEYKKNGAAKSGPMGSFGQATNEAGQMFDEQIPF